MIIQLNKPIIMPKKGDYFTHSLTHRLRYCVFDKTEDGDGGVVLWGYYGDSLEEAKGGKDYACLSLVTYLNVGAIYHEPKGVK